MHRDITLSIGTEAALRKIRYNKSLSMKLSTVQYNTNLFIILRRVIHVINTPGVENIFSAERPHYNICCFDIAVAVGGLEIKYCTTASGFHYYQKADLLGF